MLRAAGRVPVAAGRYVRSGRPPANGEVTLGEAFSFMSGLYFRGKLAYAVHFTTWSPRCWACS